MLRVLHYSASFLCQLKINLVLMKQFQIKDNKLIHCDGEFVLGKEGLEYIELNLVEEQQ